MASRVRDITERKRTQLAVVENAEDLQRERRFFSGGPVTVFQWKAKEGWPVTYVSPNVSQFGYSTEMFTTGMLLYASLIHPEDSERVRAEVAAYTGSGCETFEQEYRLRRADGCFRWVYDFTRVVRNEHGQAVSYDGYILDITERRRAEQELQLNEARYRAVVEGSIQGICVIRSDGCILFANPALAAIFGYDHQREMIGSTVLAHVARKDRGRLSRYARARLRGEAAPIRYEFQGLKRDGAPLWLEVLVSVVSWDEETAILATLVDIKARKRVEQALQQSEKQYRTLVEQIHDGVFVIQDNVVRFANEACARMVGYPAQAFTGTEVMDVIAPEDRELVMDRYRRRQAGEDVPSQYEFRLLHRDGVSRVVVEMNAKLIQYRGRLATLGTLRDVTERKRAEARLREEAEINAALARVAQEMIVSLDTSTIVDRLCAISTEVLECDCSHTSLWMPEEEAYRTVAGYGDTPEQWEAIRAFKTPRTLVASTASRFLKASGMIELEATDPQRPYPDGVMRRFGISASLLVALRRGSQVIGTLSASYRGRRGFSARQKRLARGIAQIASLALANARLLEEVERSGRIKEDFVSTMSHELRTPLNIILGYSQLVLEETFGPLTAEQMDIIARLRKNAQELLELVNVTLDLSRLQSRRVPLDIRELPLVEFLQEFKKETQQLNKNPQLSVEWLLPSNLPTLRTDAVKLKMVLKNLLTNALKFTEKGAVVVSVASRDQGVAFTVTDTGLGIPPEDLALIFEPFRQGGAFATRRQGGVGLGLYIVQQLMDILGGKVTVFSEVGKGSSFCVWLPCERP